MRVIVDCWTGTGGGDPAGQGGAKPRYLIYLYSVLGKPVTRSSGGGGAELWVVLVPGCPGGGGDGGGWGGGGDPGDPPRPRPR